MLYTKPFYSGLRCFQTRRIANSPMKVNRYQAPPRPTVTGEKT